jgi:hypothetical protein
MIDSNLFGAEVGARYADANDVASEQEAALLANQLANGARLVPSIAKGWVCQLPTCNDALDSERLFCNGACATAFSLLR